MSTRAAAAVLAAGLSVLASSAALPVALAEEAVPVSSPSPSPATPRKLDAEALVRELSPRVAALRGLAFKRPVAVKTIDAAAARAYFAERARRTWPEAKVAVQQRAYADLGLLPPGTDLRESLLDVLEEQAAGFYDPEADTFFVLDHTAPEAAPVIFAHELTHALDDQHFEIDKLLAATADDDDAGTAVSAVVEGSGTLVMTAFLVQEMQAGRLDETALTALQKHEEGRASRLLSAPLVLQRGLLAPYTLGMAFLLHGDATRLQKGVQPRDIDRAFRDLPRSTEEILHPEQYWGATRHAYTPPPQLPDVAGVLGPGWTLAGTGNMGEIDLALLTATSDFNPMSAQATKPELWTNAAATGVASDRYQVYRNGERSLTVLTAVFETAADAREFQTALPGRERWRAFRAERTVVLLAGDAGDAAETVAGRMLTAADAH